MDKVLEQLANDEIAKRYLIKVLNEGNFVEIACELYRQENMGIIDTSSGMYTFQKIARAITNLQSDVAVHMKRMYI